MSGLPSEMAFSCHSFSPAQLSYNRVQFLKAIFTCSSPGFFSLIKYSRFRSLLTFCCIFPQMTTLLNTNNSNYSVFSYSIQLKPIKNVNVCKVQLTPLFMCFDYFSHVALSVSGCFVRLRKQNYLVKFKKLSGFELNSIFSNKVKNLETFPPFFGSPGT